MKTVLKNWNRGLSGFLFSPKSTIKKLKGKSVFFFPSSTRLSSSFIAFLSPFFAHLLGLNKAQRFSEIKVQLKSRPKRTFFSHQNGLVKSRWSNGVSLGVEFFSNIFIKSDIYISPYSQEHTRRFPPGFGRSPNPGLAGDSKPRGGGGGIRQAWFRWMAQCMGYLLVACKGPAVKSSGQGRVSCTDTSPQLDLSIWVKYSFVIDCVCSAVWACLNVLCWHDPLLERSLSRACLGGILLARGVVRKPLATVTILEFTAGMFLRIRSAIH